MTSDLQVKTLTLTPAVVEFNFDELSTILDESLKKYEGLTFTDSTVAECKKTIAELNKGKKALSDYRLATKRELTVSITEFEEKCKELSAKFDDVINPLKEQHDKFEEDRKEEKRKGIQKIIDALLEKENLNEKFGAGLRIEDRYLNKSTSMKSIEEELTTKAEYLGISQDKEEADIQIIKSHVELINVKHGLNLIESTYVRSLDFQSADEVKERIERDAEAQLKKVTVAATKEKVVVDTVQPEEVVPVVEDGEKLVEKYRVIGTDSQLNALEEYMSSNGLSWTVIEE